jgi:hypothetical protein
VNVALRDRLEHLGPVGRSACFALVLAAALAIVFPIAIWMFGAIGLWAALLAAAVVLLASAAGTALGELANGPSEALVKMLIGMAVRMALPLAACILVQLKGGPLAAAGFVYFVLGFYLVALPVETLLAVCGIQGRTSGR